ncbi:iron uptake system protein EfeO [Flexivirga oryzae]|uniref:Iron uptake system component EfeO n=1 Tax=Flexivirga oryzae TaxID=1794944 RepID=A0A839N7N0_9MICO|nr:iron uptake system protein EfeO [Flexivirga oryzae]MBB2891225.1 iron uptake system component EfeO [Flexivirga oryzae]
MSRRTTRRVAASTLTAGMAVALAACGSSSSGGSTGSGSSAAGGAAKSSNGVTQVHITLTGGDSDTCTLDTTTAAAGPITFHVTNKSSTAITEVELQSDQRILGEKENLAPGLAPVKFTLTLTGGTYQVYCPGAKQEMQDFKVTGSAPKSTGGTASTLLNQGVKGYAKYVTGTVQSMQTAVNNLVAAVNSGDLEKAKKEYALARPFYEKIESDVDGFVLPGFKPTDNAGNLDYLIDMRQSNLDPKVGWHGFHAIEKDLWQGGKITGSTKKLAAELKTNVGKLVGLTKTLSYKPEDLANGAAGLLEEVQTEKIKGEEEKYSHLDLVDFNANVEGAQQAFAFLKPGLDKIDPALSKTIAKQFSAVEGKLNKYRDSKIAGGFVYWTPALRAKDASTLSQTVQGLQDPLSKVGEKVATAQ